MKKIHKTIAGIFTFLTVAMMPVVSTITVNANSHVTNDTTIKDKVDLNVNSSSIEAPSVIWDNTQYNMIVCYTWRVGNGGDDIAMSSNQQSYRLVGDVVYRTYEFPERAGTNHCDPDYYIGKSYNSSTKTYSSSYTSLEHEVDMGTYISVRYGYDARYTCVDTYTYWVNGVGNVPTSFDKEHFIWNHNSGSGKTIKDTFAFQDQLADINLQIPIFGYKTASITIKGETSYLRTGPNKCSIRAESSNIHTYDIRFAFGIG